MYIDDDDVLFMAYRTRSTAVYGSFAGSKIPLLYIGKVEKARWEQKVR